MPKVIRCEVCGKEMDIDEIVKEWDKSKRNLWAEHMEETGHNKWEMIDEREKENNEASPVSVCIDVLGKGESEENL